MSTCTRAEEGAGILADSWMGGRMAWRVQPEVPAEPDERMLINRQVVKREEADRRTDKQTPSVQRPSNSNTHMALYTQMDKHKGDRRLVRGDGSIRLFAVSPRSVCSVSWRVFKTYTLESWRELSPSALSLFSSLPLDSHSNCLPLPLFPNLTLYSYLNTSQTTIHH